jgi:hypothetical protein
MSVSHLGPLFDGKPGQTWTDDVGVGAGISDSSELLKGLIHGFDKQHFDLFSYTLTTEHFGNAALSL